MDFSYYVFAFFIFVLAAIIVILTKKIKGADSKDNKVIYEKEKKLFKLYQNLEEMILVAEEFIEEAHKEIAADKSNIHSMLEKAEDLYRQAQNEIDNYIIQENKEEKKTTQGDKKKTEPVKNKNNLSKSVQVRLLAKEGQNIEQISKELSMSQGEVALIIGLDR